MIIKKLFFWFLQILIASFNFLNFTLNHVKLSLIWKSGAKIEIKFCKILYVKTCIDSCYFFWQEKRENQERGEMWKCCLVSVGTVTVEVRAVQQWAVGAPTNQSCRHRARGSWAAPASNWGVHWWSSSWSCRWPPTLSWRHPWWWPW